MNREIKFRFWHLKDEKMIDWVWITQNAWNSFRGDTPISLLFDFLTVKKDEVVIQQFVGLLDKNGKEIYEGDILKCWDDCIVEEWSKYHIGVIVHFGLGFTLKVEENYLDWFHNAENIEVIGNINENPELLK